MLLQAKLNGKESLKTKHIGDLLEIPKTTPTPLAKVILYNLKHKKLVEVLRSNPADHLDSWVLTDEAYEKLK